MSEDKNLALQLKWGVKLQTLMDMSRLFPERPHTINFPIGEDGVKGSVELLKEVATMFEWTPACKEVHGEEEEGGVVNRWFLDGCGLQLQVIITPGKDITLTTDRSVVQ